MNVTRSSRVQSRLYRSEEVFSCRTRQEPAEALKIPVSIRVTDACGMNVSAGVVRLPDFHCGIPHRLAALAENTSAEVSNLTHGGGDAVIDDKQVIVGVEG